MDAGGLSQEMFLQVTDNNNNYIVNVVKLLIIWSGPNDYSCSHETPAGKMSALVYKKLTHMGSCGDFFGLKPQQCVRAREYPAGVNTQDRNATIVLAHFLNVRHPQRAAEPKLSSTHNHRGNQIST